MKINSKEVFLKYSLPGFERKDIDVKLSNNSILIKAKKSKKNKTQKQGYSHVENLNQNFKYATSIPKVDKSKAQIKFNKGVLTIRAPRV
ncbi:MAG: Hsp20/alpha crystallin family protein [Nanoarchaeota archaeon]